MSDLPDLPPGAFARVDEGDDAEFYRPARLVTHIDDGAIAELAHFYAKVLPRGGALLDLMSSWVSHLPDDFRQLTVRRRWPNPGVQWTRSARH